MAFDAESYNIELGLKNELAFCELRLSVFCRSLDLKLSKILSSDALFKSKVLDLDFLW